MKAVEKFKLDKKHITLIVLSLILALLIASYFIIDAVIAAIPETTEPPSYELMEGESVYAGVPVAYPRVSEAQMTYIYINNKNATFDLTKLDGEFILGFSSGKEMPESYMPPIVSAEGDFDYSTLYAVKMSADGTSAEGYLLTYLISGIGTMYFNERILLPEKGGEETAGARMAMLEKYGLTDSEAQHVYFYYTETVTGEDGKATTEERMIHLALGKQPKNNTGYYFLVGDENGYRDVIYYTANNYLDYCVGGFESFIKGQLIAPGKDGDTTYEPNLTTDFKHWKNQMYTTEGTPVSQKAQLVVVNSAAKLPLNQGPDYILPEGAQPDGYTSTPLQTMNFNLKEMRGAHPDYDRFVGLLSSNTVGKYFDADTGEGSPLYLSLISPLSDSGSKVIDFAGATSEEEYEYTIHSITAVKGSKGEITKEGTKVDKNNLVTALVTLKIDGVEQYNEPRSMLIDLSDSMITDEDEKEIRKLKIGEIEGGYSYKITYHSLVYKYVLMGVEAVITDSEEIRKEGTLVGENNLVILTYNYYVDGKIASSLPRHAVLDLSSSILDEDVVAKIRALSVGKLDSESYIDFEISYNEREAQASDESMVITAITAIYDSKGSLISKVAEDSYVTITYYNVIEGRKTSPTGITISMAELDEGDKKWEGLKEALLGLERGSEYSIELYSKTYYYEVMRDFVTYVVHSIDYFTTSEIVSSFRFVNASDRNPFYGDIYFENTLTNAYKLYGLNAGSCENVVRYLGGITSDSTSASGLSGETVAVGLTFDNMEGYGLFAHTIYFELPRGIYDKSELEEAEGDDLLSDFAWYGTIGFNLYISEEKVDTDGTVYRYVGSDMYDLIAKVPADGFQFLDKSFEDFWARPYLVLMNINNLDSITLDFNMTDVYGEFEFDLSHEIWYVGMQNGQYVAMTKPFDGASKANKQYVTITPGEDAMDTKLGEIMANKGLNSLSASVLYNELYNGGKEYYVNGSVDTVGVSNFKEAFSILQMTRYHDAVTDEEVALVHGKDGQEKMEPILSMKVKVIGGSGYYVYDFYRFADRKVMVTMYTTDDSGNLTMEKTSDFYITTRAFQKIVRAFLGVLNGETISTVDSYPDEVK